MPIITVKEFSPSSQAVEQALSFCRHLEEGSVLFFPETPFEISAEDRRFLLEVHQSGRRFHKNIAYRPQQQKITGVARLADLEKARLKRIMQRYSQQATEFLSALLAPYKSRWRPDYATFRPYEERGRDIRLRARNDRLHVDAFPTRPTGGDRILRVFTNINPSRPRQWLIKQGFEELVDQFAGTEQLPLPEPVGNAFWSSPGMLARKLARSLGLPVRIRSPYDEFMLRFHHFLKENQEFHDRCPKQTWDFPPNSTWIVYADGVAHAVLSGQYAVEQTFIVSRDAMVWPEKSPLAVLEKRCGGRLTTPV